MSSNKYIFYLSKNNNILKISKSHLNINNNNNKNYTEIYMSQCIIYPKYKKQLITSDENLTSLSISIINLDLNYDKYNSYTFKIFDINSPYIKNSLSSNINNSLFNSSNNDIELIFNVYVNNENIFNKLTIDNDSDSIIQIELFFK